LALVAGELTHSLNQSISQSLMDFWSGVRMFSDWQRGLSRPRLCDDVSD